MWFHCLILVLCICAVRFAHSGSPSMLNLPRGNLPRGILVGLVLGLVHSLLLSTGLKFPHFHFSLTFLFISPPPLPLLQPHTRLSRIHNWQVLIQSNHGPLICIGVPTCGGLFQWLLFSALVSPLHVCCAWESRHSPPFFPLSPSLHPILLFPHPIV